MDVIERSSAGGVNAFNRKVTYVACRVAHEHTSSVQQPRLSLLEADGIVTPNLVSSRSPYTSSQVVPKVACGRVKVNPMGILNHKVYFAHAFASLCLGAQGICTFYHTLAYNEYIAANADAPPLRYIKVGGAPKCV